MNYSGKPLTFSQHFRYLIKKKFQILNFLPYFMKKDLGKDSIKN